MISAALLLTVGVAVGLADVVGAQTPTVQQGDELQVNTYQTSVQAKASLAMTAEGGLVVAWSSVGSPGDDEESGSIQARRFTSDGVAIGSQFQVNSYTTGFQTLPSVAVGPGGDFVVVWGSITGSSAPGYEQVHRIKAQRHGPEGDRIGAEFEISTYSATAQYVSSVAATGDGGFVVVWESDVSVGDDGSYRSIQGRRYDSSGDPVAVQFQVNTGTEGVQESPDVAVQTNGDFVVVWESDSSDIDTSGKAIEAQRYDSAGAPLGAQFLVNSYTPGAQRRPRVSVAPSGDFVVVWHSDGSADGDVSDLSVQGRRFVSSGTPLGAQFQVNTYTTGDQEDPSVSMDAEGDLVVIWDSEGSFSGDPNDARILGQRYSSSGDPIGTEFFVNASTSNSVGLPVVVAQPEGDFVAVWERIGVQSSIELQRFRVTADLGDSVFEDADYDGRRDGSEPGAPGVGVHLRSELGDLLASTVTDEEGGFLFRPKIALDGVADRFFLEFEAPAGFAFTAPNVGPDEAIDSDAEPASGETATVEVSSAGDDRNDLDAGLIANHAALGDRVWYDANYDDVQQFDEAGVGGVVVRLLGSTGAQIASTTTDDDGLYTFEVESGLYTLEISLPEGMEFAAQDVGGDEAIDSDIEPTSGRSQRFVYSGGIDRKYDAGIRYPAGIFSDGFETGGTNGWSGTVN